MQRKYTKPVQIKTEQANMLRGLVANLMDIPTPPELVAARLNGE